MFAFLFLVLRNAIFVLRFTGVEQHEKAEINRHEKCRGSRNLVGIAIQLSDSEEEEFFVGYPMLISPEKFDFGVE